MKYFRWTQPGNVNRIFVLTKLHVQHSLDFGLVERFSNQNHLRHALSVLCRNGQIVDPYDLAIVLEDGEYRLYANCSNWRGRGCFLGGILHATRHRWNRIQSRRRRRTRNRKKVS